MKDKMDKWKLSDHRYIDYYPEGSEEGQCIMNLEKGQGVSRPEHIGNSENLIKACNNYNEMVTLLRNSLNPLMDDSEKLDHFDNVISLLSKLGEF